MTWRLVAIRPFDSTTKPVPSPCRLPSRPIKVMTTTDFLADSASCSTDLAGAIVAESGLFASLFFSVSSADDSPTTNSPATISPNTRCMTALPFAQPSHDLIQSIIKSLSGGPPGLHSTVAIVLSTPATSHHPRGPHRQAGVASFETPARPAPALPRRRPRAATI